VTRDLIRKRGGQILFLSLLLVISVAASRSKRHHSQRAIQGRPGEFDYYVLSLSWSPEFCYSHPAKPECQSGHRGFVVHGLWPQYAQGYPEHCSNAPGLSDPSAMTDIMPDAGLVAHEWSTHGTCSGLDAENYFRLLRQAFTSIKIPERFAASGHTFSIPPFEIKKGFLQANPNFREQDMTVSCGNNYLTAVSFCMTKDLKPTSCQNLRDCKANVIRVPAVR
jgi:ribonuclease T2